MYKTNLLAPHAIRNVTGLSLDIGDNDSWPSPASGTAPDRKTETPPLQPISVATRHRKAPSQPTFGTRHLSSSLNVPGPGSQYMQRSYPIKTVAENGRHPRCNVTPTTTTHTPYHIPRQNATRQGCNPPRPLAENSVYCLKACRQQGSPRTPATNANFSVPAKATTQAPAA